jgi:hypothetical protein
MVPGGVGLTDQTVELRGATGAISRTLPAGEFQLVVPVKAGVTELPFSFSQQAALPGQDGRLVAALLTLVSVTSEH